jgi:chromosome partitioning protein
MNPFFLMISLFYCFCVKFRELRNIMRRASEAESIKPSLDIETLKTLAAHSNAVVKQVRTSMLAPTARKSAPTYNTTQMASLCGLDLSRVRYNSKKGELPSGEKEGSTRREWTLEEARIWVRHFKSDDLRDPALASACVITIANFKGGVAKTTTAAALAQGLSLRGHRVLIVDTDPQGSLTTLFGVLPDTEVEDESTILPLCAGEETSIMPAVQKTYWDGIDLVAAAPLLFNAEFLLPTRQKEEPGFKFWNVLDDGLEEARNEYDVIIIDTPPALSYITINSLMAADGVIMPLPPSTLDFASSAQFWNLFTDVVGGLLKHGNSNKCFSFLDVVLSRVDRSADSMSNTVREWIISAYGSKVIPIEIPKTSIATASSAEFGTVYDMSRDSADQRTLKRAVDAYDQLVDYVATQIYGVWSHQADVVESYLKTANLDNKGDKS